MMRHTHNASEISRRRVFDTRDMVKRVGVISPKKIKLVDYPIETPQAAFNPAVYIFGDYAYIYARIEVGYYTYSSAISLIKIPVNDIVSGKLHDHTFESRLVILPSTRDDIWGAEDPRITEVDGTYYMVYTGRTTSYPDEDALLRYTPIIAVSEDGERWNKHSVLINEELDGGLIVGDKDAFIVRRDSYYVFHRPTLLRGRNITTVSKAHVVAGKSGLYDTRVVLEKASFEDKIGWGTPIVDVEGRSITFLHGVDGEIKAYRVFAASIGWSREGPYVENVTTHYIMGPREIYEVYGDRPYTVFPTGAFVVDGSIYIVYGAGDMVIGIGAIEASQLLHILGY